MVVVLEAGADVPVAAVGTFLLDFTLEGSVVFLPPVRACRSSGTRWGGIKLIPSVVGGYTMPWMCKPSSSRVDG